MYSAEVTSPDRTKEMAMLRSGLQGAWLEGVRAYGALSLCLAAGSVALVAASNLLPKRDLTPEEAAQLQQELDARQAANKNTDPPKVKWDPADANAVLQEIENETGSDSTEE